MQESIHRKQTCGKALVRSSSFYQGPSHRLFACFVKNLAEAVADYEVFPWLHGHRDNLQMIRTLPSRPIRVMDASEDPTGITVRQHLDPWLTGAQLLVAFGH